jgi:hypothetical protein
MGRAEKDCALMARYLHEKAAWALAMKGHYAFAMEAMLHSSPLQLSWL